jgi:hypothetical protein
VFGENRRLLRLPSRHRKLFTKTTGRCPDANAAADDHLTDPLKVIVLAGVILQGTRLRAPSRSVPGLTAPAGDEIEALRDADCVDKLVADERAFAVHVEDSEARQEVVHHLGGGGELLGCGRAMLERYERPVTDYRASV